MTTQLAARTKAALHRMESSLLSEFKPDRPWRGTLSSSAIATSIAVFTLRVAGHDHDRQAMEAGLEWLRRTRNADGGWGDSPESPSNLTATLLTWFASGGKPDMGGTWLHQALGGTGPDTIAQAVRARYGHDKTFAVPILTMGTLARCLGPEREAWRRIPQLPFEFAAVPQRFFRFMNMGVVSYAMPALIAIGLVRHHHAPTRLKPLAWLRNRLTARLLDLAAGMQPRNGGYEEATPLTGFVTMSLLSSGFGNHGIVQRGLGFLRDSQRTDGSWPIDSDLATWVTAHAVNILLEPGTPPGLANDQRQGILLWLLGQQHTRRHPLTGGHPGGWGWTDLPGAMPDADDTAAVLLALRKLDDGTPATAQAARQAVAWLLDLQNRDGGIPTFSRGWGKLPFDRSCPDLTAHALEAIAAWAPDLDPVLSARSHRAMARMLRYLEKSQTPAGSWLPLWFGSQDFADETNPVYGTARALLSLGNVQLPANDPSAAHWQRMISLGREFLRKSEHPEGGWGAQSGASPSIEETAMAIAALLGSGNPFPIEDSLKRLLDLTRDGAELPASPIGLYFARLWYAERLYPLLFSVAALRGYLRATRDGRSAGH